jgi:hypothetical protein
MTATEKMQIAIVVRILRSPRDRWGTDHADQAQMILCGMINQPMQSIWS